jgi:hypothetical protein
MFRPAAMLARYAANATEFSTGSYRDAMYWNDTTLPLARVTTLPGYGILGGIYE